MVCLSEYKRVCMTKIINFFDIFCKIEEELV